MPKIPDGKLTPKEDAFVAEYVSNGGNALQAAIKAYPSVTYETARSVARDNPQKPRIKSVLHRLYRRQNALPRSVKVIAECLNDPEPHVRLGAARTVVNYYSKRESDRRKAINSRQTVNNTQVNFFVGKDKRLIDFFQGAGRWPSPEEERNILQAGKPPELITIS